MGITDIPFDHPLRNPHYVAGLAHGTALRVDALEKRIEALEKALAAQERADPSQQHAMTLSPHLQFALRLYHLLEEFNAELNYTVADDGIHMSIGDDYVFDGATFFDRRELRQLLIDAGVLADQEQANG
jgi:uncharacterized coiled-coil protein SlyX